MQQKKFLKFSTQFHLNLIINFNVTIATAIHYVNHSMQELWHPSHGSKLQSKNSNFLYVGSPCTPVEFIAMEWLVPPVKHSGHGT